MSAATARLLPSTLLLFASIGCVSHSVDHGFVCGDGSVDGLEKCDDGNSGRGDGCDPECFVEPGWRCIETEPSACVPDAMVVIPAGRYTLGSPVGETGRDGDETAHDVVLTRAFALLSTEVSQGEFDATFGWNPSSYPACGADCPVTNVSWFDAIAYANQRSAAMGSPECYRLSAVECVDGSLVGDNHLDCMTESGLGIRAATLTLISESVYDCSGFRLPTESEWEIAARAGTTGATYAGDLDALDCQQPNDALDQIAWFCGNSGEHTRPRAGLQPNAWGLYDMLGNVWEWVHDYYLSSYPRGPLTDPEGPDSATYRINRGGGFSSDAQRVRAANRTNDDANTRLGYIGFRVARTLAN